MTSRQPDRLFWLGGAAAVGLGFGLMGAILGEPARGAAGGVTAALAWLVVVGIRRARRRSDRGSR